MVGEPRGWWLVMAVCPGETVRTCVSVLFAAATASGSAAMLQHTAPSATFPLHPRGCPPARVLGISSARSPQCLCTSSLNSAFFPSTSLPCPCSPLPAVFLVGVHSTSLVFQCLSGANCSHQIPPRQGVCTEELDSMTLVGSFQLRTFCDPMRDPLSPLPRRLPPRWPLP